jgi:hypothetical protein
MAIPKEYGGGQRRSSSRGPGRGLGGPYGTGRMAPPKPKPKPRVVVRIAPKPEVAVQAPKQATVGSKKFPAPKPEVTRPVSRKTQTKIDTKVKLSNRAYHIKQAMDAENKAEGHYAKVAGLTIHPEAGLKPGLAALELAATPVHAIAGAADAAAGRDFKGLTPAQLVAGAKKGIHNKTLYSDVLKTAGVKSKAVRGVAGFAGDVLLDPTTYVTFGTTSIAKEAASKAGARVAEKALKQGMTHDVVKRLASQAAKKAAKETEGNAVQRAVTVGVGKHKVKVIPLAAKRSPKKLTADVAEAVNPRFVHPLADEAAQKDVKSAHLEARGRAATGTGQVVRQAHELAKLAPEDQRQLIDAIEAGKVGSLPEHLRDPAIFVRSRLRHMARGERQQGILGKTIEDYFPHVRRSDVETADKIRVGKGQGANPARLASSKHRQITETLAQMRATHPDLPFTEDLAHAFSVRGRASAEGIARSKLIQDVAKTGRPLKPGAEIDTAKELVYRVSPTGLKPLVKEAGDKIDLDTIEKLLRTPEERAALLDQAKEKSAAAKALRAALKPKVKRISPQRVVKRTTAAFAKTDRVREREAGKLEVLRRQLEDVPTLKPPARAAARRQLTTAIKGQEKRLALVKANRELAYNRVTAAQKVAEPYYNAFTKTMGYRKRGVLGKSVQAADAELRYMGAKRVVKRVADTPEIQQLRGEASALRREARHVEPGQHVILNKKVVQNLEQRLKAPAGGPLARGLIDRPMGALKTTLTVLNPPYHARNLIGDSWNSYLSQSFPQLAAGFKHSVQGQRALQHLHKAEGQISIGATSKKVAGSIRIKGQDVPYEDFIKRARDSGVVDSGFYGRDIVELVKGPTGPGHHPLDVIRRVGQARENLVRLNTFATALKRGLSDREAARVATEHHFDYGDLSQVEKTLLRRVFPFYTFTARNAPLQARKLATRPGKFANLEKLREELGKATGLPVADRHDYQKNLRDYEQLGMPFPVPGLKVGGKKQLAYLSLPTTDLNR